MDCPKCTGFLSLLSYGDHIELHRCEVCHGLWCHPDHLANMKEELRDKQVGLLKASEDKSSYYRADHLLKETQLVLEATCRACAAGEQR